MKYPPGTNEWLLGEAIIQTYNDVLDNDRRMWMTSKPLRILITDPALVEPLQYLAEAGHTLDFVDYSAEGQYHLVLGSNCAKLTVGMLRDMPKQTLEAMIKGARELIYGKGGEASTKGKATRKGKAGKGTGKRGRKAKGSVDTGDKGAGESLS